MRKILATIGTSILGLILIISIPLGIWGYSINQVPEGVDEYAQRVINLLKENNLDTLQKELVDEYKEDINSDILNQISEQIGTKPITTTRLLQFPIKQNGFVRRNLTYEIAGDEIYNHLQIIVDDYNGNYRLAGFQLNPLQESLLFRNTFSLSKITQKPLPQQIILLFAILVPIFIISVAVYCLFKRGTNWKKWFIFILFGFFGISINWTTGAISFSPLTFQLLGAGVSRGLLELWSVTTSIPLGAIIYLLVKRKTVTNR